MDNITTDIESLRTNCPTCSSRAEEGSDPHCFICNSRDHKKRVIISYSLHQQNIMKNDKQIILLQLDNLTLKGKSVIFENQEIIASNVVTMLKNRKIINIMVVSKTQSGKTGSMCATIKRYLEDTSNLIPIDNIYIITGLSSCEWKDQTTERMPESLHTRVYHRCELPKTFVDEIKDKKNILIIMDEIQVAAKKGQTIAKTFEKAGLLNKSTLYEKDIKIIEFTATPDGTIYDLMKWNDASSKILAEVGDGYISSYDLFKMGRVKQYKDLCGYSKDTNNVDESVFENIQEIKMDVDHYNIPLYHIIRTKTGYLQDITIHNFKQIFNMDSYDFKTYDGESDIEDINKTLLIKPAKHTLIFIKEMLRCAKTLEKSNIGILYDRYNSTPDDTTIIQGLIGRDTGYDNNCMSICYTNISSIERYEELWKSKFEDKTIPWKSNTTKYRRGITLAKETFNKLNDSDEVSHTSYDKEPIIKKFKTQEEAKEYFKETFESRGPNKRKPNVDGFYEATIRSEKRVYSCEDVYNERKYGLTYNNYRYCPCYEDLNELSTLQWWIIHY